MLATLAVTATPALASTEGVGWELTSRAYPTNLAPGGTGLIEIEVFNTGAASSSGAVTVTDTLPPGLEATEAGELLTLQSRKIGHGAWSCSGITVVTCVNNEVGMKTLLGGGGGRGTVNSEIDEGGPAPIAIAVKVTAKAPAVQNNQITINGGGAATSAAITAPVTISPTHAGFSIARFDGWSSNADGTIDTQAGSHPYETVFNLDFASQEASAEEGGGFIAAGAEARNLEATVPPGFAGNLNAIPACTRQELDHGFPGGCPASSQIGLATVIYGGGRTKTFQVFNMVPPPGVPAEFALQLEGIDTFFDAQVRTGRDNSIAVRIDNTPQRDILNATLILWGVPGDPSHDRWRSPEPKGCTENCSTGAEVTPFLVLPTACGPKLQFSIGATNWQNGSAAGPASFSSHDAKGGEVGITGCERLGFGPSITTAPETASADTTTGLTVEVKPPLGGLLDPNGLGTADIQNTTVTLPEGLVINPGQAAGLQACPPGRPGPERHPGDALTTAGEKEKGEEDAEAPECPVQSKVGTVQIETPLLKDKLEGGVYILPSNPPQVKLLVAASADGVNLKLVGVVNLNEQTGRLESKFEATPELPFTNFKLSFNGGTKAALDTPTQCGKYPTEAIFTPWSQPIGETAFTNASFSITEATGGGSPCPSSPLPFSPSLTAGSTSDQAGGFTNFSLELQRGDGQQRIEKLQLIEPAGLAGLISHVPLCPEPQASKGECGEASRIGHALTASGPGAYPLVIPQPGNPESPIYLTGRYQGAPFGLTIVTHVIAGPFNLGIIVTRAKIQVDPRTAQITITTDPLPQIEHGVPTDLRLVQSVIDRPNFLFNPTNCNPQEFTGTAWGTPPPGAGGPGTTAPVSSRFRVGSCQALTFGPRLGVSTGPRASKVDGASLTFKISYPKGALGTQSWFNEAKFDIPKQLPARLTTLQKACLASVFQSNPAACPAASLIGHAAVHTPVLPAPVCVRAPCPAPLEGPVYFVSHGGAKFPDAVIVLQGDGVTVDLVGETFINGRTGITSATFRNTPDVPFENIEVTLPSGPFSEFGANLPAKARGSFCGQKLVMPTLFKAQNGLEIHQNTKVGVTGCTKAKKHRAHKARRHNGRRARRKR